MNFKVTLPDEMSEQAEHLRVRFLACLGQELFCAQHWQTLTTLPIWLDKLAHGTFDDAHQASDVLKGLSGVYNQFEQTVEVGLEGTIVKPGVETYLPIEDMRDFMLFYDCHRSELSELQKAAGKALEMEAQDVEAQDVPEARVTPRHPPSANKGFFNRMFGS